MTEHAAILVPADLAEDHRVITWDDAHGGLLPLLYRELGPELDAATVLPPGGPTGIGLRLWTRDRSLQVADPDWNDRAIAVCRHWGYQVDALAGPIVFLGNARGEDEVGLGPEMLNWLDTGLTAATQAARTAADPGITKMRPDDPAYWMLSDGHTSTPVVYRPDCYICRDPEFAQMGLPLCRLCPACKTGHVPADDTVCDDCGHDELDDQFGPTDGEPAAEQPAVTVTMIGDSPVSLDEAMRRLRVIVDAGLAHLYEPEAVDGEPPANGSDMFGSPDPDR